MYNIEAIFAVPGSGHALYALKFDEENYAAGENELYKVFRQWQDPDFLVSFFRANQVDLAFFGKHMTVARAMERTVNESYDLFEELVKAITEAEKGNFSGFDDLFDNVDKRPRYTDFVEQRVKQSWLRLFAVRTDDDLFFITGGAIKLTAAHQDAPHTDKELKKARAVAKYFRQAVDNDRFYEVYEMII